MKEPASKNVAAHFVDALNGAPRQKLTCHRCQRSLPEKEFAFIGSRLRPAKSLYGTQKIVTVLHGHCATCRKQAKGKWANHPLYTPELDRFWSNMSRTRESVAKTRGIIWALDKDDLIGKYLEQDGLCAYSGLQMNYAKTGPTTATGSHLSAPSIDRTDSAGHYTPDNIQIVMAAVNIMKGEVSEDVFLQLCRQITVNRMLS